MNEPTTADVLRAARELYAKAPSHAPDDSDVAEGTVCPLMATAIAAEIAGVCDGGAAADDALHAIVRHGIVRWNAENSTETVLAAFDRAIEATS